MTTLKAASARREVLERIEAAQNELYAADASTIFPTFMIDTRPPTNYNTAKQ